MWLADGPAHVGGRSATLTLFVPERVFSGQACGLLCGRSAAGGRTVRRPFDNLNQKHCCLCLIFKDELRTVRSFGADGTLANFNVVPETGSSLVLWNS
jgi:hypothetical protein